MVKEWFSSRELITVSGLPSTIQGINRKARVEGWKSRKRSGIQGKAIEYHIDSFPSFVKTYLHAQEFPMAYSVSPIEPLQLWTSVFLQLTNEEKDIVATWLMRNGVKNFIHFVKNDSEIDHD